LTTQPSSPRWMYRALACDGSFTNTIRLFVMTEGFPRRMLGAPAEPDVRPAPPEVEEVEQEEEDEGTDEPWFVILFNDEVHTFEEVIGQLVKATGCSRSEAEDMAWTVHNEGKATVYEGTFEECFEVQSVLKEIQLVTEIQG